MGDKQVLRLVVTEEQKELIYAMWQHNDWDLETVEDTNTSDQSDEQPITEFRIPQDATKPECQYCLCQPCITDETNRQMWWETEVYQPHKRNSSMRKTHYKKFWTMLLHKGVWNDPRYLVRKEAAAMQDPRRKIAPWIGPTKSIRDIMPDCVLQLVRGWLPNPSSIPYMGHKNF